MKFIVLAGGKGSKLWPYSKENYPKQFSDILGEQTLLQRNVHSLLQAYPARDIFISINEEQIPYVEKQVPMIPKENYIIEPAMAKDSGPASLYAMSYVSQRYPDEIIMFYVQPVVVRKPISKYLEFIEDVEIIVRDTGSLVTGGKKLNTVETGSDLFELEENDISDKVNTRSRFFKVKRFHSVVDQKLKAENVAEIMKSSSVSTHCNHYTWTAEKLFAACKRIKPEWYAVVIELQDAIRRNDSFEVISQIYSKFSKGRIEQLTQVLYNEGSVIVGILPFDWVHITTWGDVYNYLMDEGESVIRGNVVLHESERNLVFSKTGRIVTLVGVSDLVLVETEDSVLVIDRNDTGQIKRLIEKLESTDNKRFL